MTQYARPNSDISNPSPYWTPEIGATLYGELAESSINDYTFIESSNRDNHSCEVGLNSVVDPGVHTAHYVRYRALRNSTSKTLTLTCSLYCGATLIASQSQSNMGDTFTTYTITLTETQAGNITDYSDLSLVFSVTNSATYCQVSYAQLEVPDPTAKGSQSAYLHGADNTSGSQSAFIKPSENTLDNIPVYLWSIAEGEEQASDSQAAYISTWEPVDSSIPAYTKAEETALDSTPCYLRGYDPHKRLHAYTIGCKNSETITWADKVQWEPYWDEVYEPDLMTEWDLRYGVVDDSGQNIFAMVYRKKSLSGGSAVYYAYMPYYSTDFGDTWTWHSGLGNGAYIYDMGISRDGTKILLAWRDASMNYELQYSSNNFSSFSIIASGNYINKASISPDGSTIVYFDSTNTELQKSTNGGSNWTEITPSSYTINGNSNIFLNEDGTKIALNGLDGSTPGLVYSVNGGSSWGFVSLANITGLSGTTGWVYQIEWARDISGIYVQAYYDSGYTICKSTDWFQTWEVVRPKIGGYMEFLVSNSGLEVVDVEGVNKSWDEFIKFYDISGTHTFDDVYMSMNGKYFVADEYTTTQDPIHGYDWDTLHIYIGYEPIRSSIPAIVVSSIPESTSSQECYLKGKDTGSSQQSAYLFCGVSTKDSVSAYMLGGGADTSDTTPAYLYGRANINDSSTAYLKGSSSEQDNQQSYLAGNLTDLSSQYAFLDGKDTSLDNQPAYLEGDVSIAESSINAYTIGLIRDSQSLYLGGNIFTNSYQPAYICTSTENVVSSQPAYITSILRSSINCFMPSNTTTYDYIILETSDQSLIKKFLVLKQGYDDGTKNKIETIHKTISGGLDINIGELYTAWRMIIKVRQNETDASFGDLEDLEYFYSLNNPNGTPSNLITFVDHHGINCKVHINGQMKKNLITVAVEGQDAIYFYGLELTSVI